ncbi:MAG: hypothetical protein HC801_13190, partial [Nitrospira sp.]|nr:hypothetical protein [Nitrospira sp.]
MPRLTVDGETLSEEASGTVNLDLPGNFIDVVLADGSVTLDSVTFRGVCESASAWDGAVCTPYSIRLDERIPTTFLENRQPVELEVVEHLLRPRELLGPEPFERPEELAPDITRLSDRALILTPFASLHDRGGSDARGAPGWPIGRGGRR